MVMLPLNQRVYTFHEILQPNTRADFSHPIFRRFFDSHLFLKDRHRRALVEVSLPNIAAQLSPRFRLLS